MSQLPPNPAMMPPPSPGDRRRPTSVTLREQGAEQADMAAMMDPASKSLADALRICYRLLQGTMVVLGLLFLFSGVRTVNTGEKGIRLLFGRPEATDLPPGAQFTLPEPIGELVKVGTGAQSVRLDEEFWPAVSQNARGKPLSEIRGEGKERLDPAADGSLITADGNLAHARFSVLYRRDNIVDNARYVAPGDEPWVVRAAVRRGAVLAAATVSIDELRSGLPDETRQGTFISMSRRTREAAQEMLNRFGAGIVIDDVSILDPTAPLFLITAFEGVQTAQSQAKEAIDKAGQDRVKRLSGVAGAAAEPLLRMIDQYDRHLAKGELKEGEAVLAGIDAVLDGRPYSFEGFEVPTGAVSGEVAQRLSAAREYRSSAVSRAAADATMFEGKLEAFRQNPEVVMTGDWTQAFTRFMSRDNVEAHILPPGSHPVQLSLNRDPELVRKSALRFQRDAADRRNKAAADQAEAAKFGEVKKARTEESGPQ
ncbi:MAG: SPFH domain-containing protein [Phycisphaerales bacterium]